MKRTCLFTKSAGREKLEKDPMEGLVETVTSTNPLPTPNTTTPNNTTTIDDSNWFDRNQQKIGIGMMGLGSGMLLATYIMQKAHAKDMRRLIEKEEKQKEEK